MNKETNIDRQMLKAISSELENVTTDYAEIAIDQAFNGIAEEIPVVKSLLAIWKTGKSVRDAFLIKKMLAFLHELSDTTIEDRQDFIRRLEEEGYQTRAGEQLIIYLDRLEHVTKARLMARAIKIFINGDCDTETLLRLWYAIDKIDYINISKLPIVYSDDYYRRNEKHKLLIWQNLAMSGLVTINAEVDQHNNYEAGIEYSKNDLGELFLRLLD